MLSYVELLEDAKGRYREIYEKLVPEGAQLPGATSATTQAQNDEEDIDEEQLLTELAPEQSRSIGI